MHYYKPLHAHYTHIAAPPPPQIFMFVRGGENFKHKKSKINKNTTLKICLRQILRKKKLNINRKKNHRNKKGEV